MSCPVLVLKLELKRLQSTVMTFIHGDELI